MRLPTIETTEDGSQTLRHPLTGETYHSMRGAVGESEYVFLGEGLRSWLDAQAEEKKRVRIFEVGFGTGLNCLLTARFAALRQVLVEYTSIERYPLPYDVWGQMEYASDPLFRAMHSAAWGTTERISEWMALHKIMGDMTKMAPDGAFDVIYMDAFSPDTDPQMWSVQVFDRLFACTAHGGLLVTYSSDGEVRRAMEAAGYAVEKLPGALGKRHMLRGAKNSK